MPTQQGKLYRSGINFHPVTLNNNQISDYGKQLYSRETQKDNNKKSTLQHTVSHANLKSKQLNHSIQNTKQTLPFLNIKQVQNTSFMSIDDAYLNPKFQKKKQIMNGSNNKILPNNITNIQFDNESIGGRSIKTYQGQDQYYKYWKSKAHQYLQQNFKLRQQNKKLKSQLESNQKSNLQSKRSHLQQKKQSIKQLQNDIQVRQDKSFSYLQSIFKKKLDELQNELKQKNIKIISLEDKVLQMNSKIIGEQERTQLIQRLGSQIDTLTKQNITLKKQIYQISQKQKQKSQQIINKQQNNTLNKRYRSKDKHIFNNNRISSSPDRFKNNNNNRK